jgi:hypothetical protein
MRYVSLLPVSICNVKDCGGVPQVTLAEYRVLSFSRFSKMVALLTPRRVIAPAEAPCFEKGIDTTLEHKACAFSSEATNRVVDAIEFFIFNKGSEWIRQFSLAIYV